MEERRADMNDIKEMLKQLVEDVGSVKIHVTSIDERVKAVERNTADLGNIRTEVSKNVDFRKTAIGVFVTGAVGIGGWIATKLGDLLS